MIEAFRATLSQLPKPMERALQLSKRSLVSVGVFSGTANLLMLVPAFFMLSVYDKAVGNNSVSTLWVLSGLTAVMFLALGIMETVRSRVLIAISERLDHILGPSIYEAMFRHSVEIGAHRATSQPIADLNSLRQFLTGVGVLALFDAPWLPIYIVILFLFHPLLGWMGVIAALLFLFVALLNQRVTSAALMEANSLAARNNADTGRNLRNAEVAKVLGMMDELQRQWREKQTTVIEKQGYASTKASTFNAVTKTLRLAVQSAALAAGAYLALVQEISPGMIIAGSILIGRALQPVEMAVGAWKGYVDARDQYKRLAELLTKVPPAPQRMPLPPVVGKLTVTEAAISAPGSLQPLVTEASFQCSPGTATMVVGPSGAGKSTLIRGILGVWPTVMGTVRLDDAEIKHYGETELGPQIGYLPQDIELLQGSVSENIARFGELDADGVVQAAMDAGVHEVILSLDDGYDTQIEMAGGMLSPGQRQRIALARALYKRPKLVLLDEPNSNLDEAGELALNSAITLLKESGSTVIIVSHRQTILPLIDQLVVMAKGRVVDVGSVDEVARNVNAVSAQRAKTKKIRPTTTVVPVG